MLQQITSNPAVQDNEAKPKRSVALVELIFFITLALVSKAVLAIFIWRYAGPVSLIALLGVLGVYLVWKKESITHLGLCDVSNLKSMGLLIPQALLCVVAILLTGGGIAVLGEAMGIPAFQTVPAGIEERFGEIAGNLNKYLLWMVIAWLGAGLGEEIMFRGFLITRFERVFRGLPLANVLGVIAAATLFGMGHMYYQGLRGLITTGAIGLILGTLFLVYKRNIWPLVIGHALVDSLMFTALYTGADI